MKHQNNDLGIAASSWCTPIWAGLLLILLLSALIPSRVEAGKRDAGPLFPKPGTYELHQIQKMPSEWVLEGSAWLPMPLNYYTSGKITLFSFFYATCRDPQGCPAIWSAFENIHAELLEQPELHGKVRLVFVSLDPRLDTPERLVPYAITRQDTHDKVPWHFLTTWSDRYLGTILEGLGQSAARDLDANGHPLPTISHQVKFYLIDKDSWVREIYTSGFFNPEVVLNDIETLNLE